MKWCEGLNMQARGIKELMSEEDTGEMNKTAGGEKKREQWHCKLKLMQDNCK